VVMTEDKNKNEEDIKIENRGSSLAEFTKRPVPTNEELEEFEDFVEEETREGEIEDGLNEIYQDDNGKMVDVKKMYVKKRHGFLFWFFSLFFALSAVAISVYYGYNFLFLESGTNAKIDFLIEGNTEALAGEEFFYTIHYKNLSNIAINNARIEVSFPDNFIFLDSFPESNSDNNSVWEIAQVAGNESDKIRIKGMMIGSRNDTGILVANMTYTPENFSSQFKEDASITTVITGVGFNIDFNYISTALVGQEDDILIKITPEKNNFIDNFRITMEPAENIELLSFDKKIENQADFEMIRPGVWNIKEIKNEENILPVRFKFTEKFSDYETIIFNFEQLGGDNKYFKFYEKVLDFEVMKSDLNLTLIINGSREDQGVDFGEKLNYSIVYQNKGETEMKDVIIMAVLNSEFLDWTTLSDNLGGREKGNTIIWSKDEIGDLESLKQNQEGTIDFSINMAGFGNISAKKEYQVKSYAQFSVGTNENTKFSGEDNRSNTIINKINSDLKLVEELRYFNEDNIPVGTGPNPPKVGEETTYKVYWKLSNNLHELNDLKVSVKLPNYVFWSNKTRATVGEVEYDSSSHSILWDIGRLPITVYEASAEFAIGVNPTEDDKNKIMVIVPGTTVTAIDGETKDKLEYKTKAKTTKLEDDPIAGGQGVVE